MLNKHKYWKSTLGVFADVLIVKQVDYSGTGASSVATFSDFVTSAVEGEFAFFNADTLAVITGVPVSSVIPVVGSNVKIFGALKRDGAVEKTSIFTTSTFEAKRVPYAAAVAQASKATFTGTPVLGNYYSVKVMETTPGYQPFPSWEYGVTATTGESLSSVLTRLVALVNDGTNVINKNTDSIVTATLSSTTVTFTAKQAGITFRLAFSSASINDIAAAAVYTGSGTANAFWGNGTYDQVAELEFEANVYKGVTTQYPNQGARPEDFGQPTAFAVVGVQYNTYILTGSATQNSHTPLNPTVHSRRIILAIPSNGTANADTEVKGILGL